MAENTECSSYSAAENSTSFINSLKAELDDAHYQQLKKVFTKTGRGAPQKITPGQLTHKLVLQLELLRMETGKSWDDLNKFFFKTVIGDPLQGLALKSEIEATVKAAKSARCHQGDTFGEFLAVDLGLSIKARNTGFTFLKHGISREHLLNPHLLKSHTPPQEVTNEVMIDLQQFNNREKTFTCSQLCEVLKFLGIDVSHLSSQMVSKKMKKIYSTYESLRKSSKKEGGAENMTKFLSQPPDFSIQTKTPEPCQPSMLSPENLKHAASERTQAKLRRQLEDTETELKSEKTKTDTLSESIQDKNKEIQRLSDEVIAQKRLQNKSEERKKKLQSDIQNLEMRLRQEKAKVTSITSSNLYKRLYRQEKELRKEQAVLDAHKEGQCEAKIKAVRKKIKNVQTDASNVRKEVEKLRPLKNQIRDLLTENDDLRARMSRLEEENKIIRLKDPETGYFTSSAKVLIMELVGQHEISTERCGAVIEAVCRHIVGAEVPKTDLPSPRSAGRFVDVGHVLGKMQVTDSIMTSEHVDVHSDGTTKCGKKVVGHQVTLDNGVSLSCGYTVVGSENASTLVDIAIGLLEELSLVYEDDINKRHEVFITLLERISALMSDRAAVMKAYGRQFDAARSDLLNCDENLAFLYCNAHFLLGLVGGVNKVLKNIPEGDPLGRNKLKKFEKRGGEHAVTKCIREACAILGPRGDERYGCREYWLAYCMMNNIRSEVTSFKGNRFNNLFQASAALHLHRQDVLNFLDVYMPSRNWKQDGVLADLTCDVLDNYLVALGLFYFRLTGPYWNLLGQDIHYLDFFAYVVMMKQFLERWSTNPADAFSLDFEPLFDINMEVQNNRIFTSLLSISEERKEAVRVILQLLSTAFLDVVVNQLAEFLPAEQGREAGKYYNNQDEDLRRRLASSKLTNLVGERCFGDLDFSVFKRRNASSHYHSTISLMKSNETISKWYTGLPENQQRALLASASSKAPALRKKHQQEEKKATEARQRHLQESRQKKTAAENKRRERKNVILERLRPHQGPCTRPRDVTRLMHTYQTNTKKEFALKAEMMFQKLFMKESSPLLKAGVKLPDLVQNLKAFLRQACQRGEPDDARNEEDEAAVEGNGEEVDMEDDTDEVTEVVAEEEEMEVVSEEEEMEEVEGLTEEDERTTARVKEAVDGLTSNPFTFKDVGQGTRVLVGYEEDYFIGEVERVIDPSLAEINFFERCTVKDDTYRWPLRREDRDTVHAKFVLASDLHMSSTSTGRMWVLQDADFYAKLFLEFHRTFFQ